MPSSGNRAGIWWPGFAMREIEARIDAMTPVSHPFLAPRRAVRPLRTHSSHQAPTRQVNVCQTQRHKCPRRVLGQAPVAHLGKAKLPLDHCKDMLHPRAHLRFDAVDDALKLGHDAAAEHTLVGAVLGRRRLGLDQFLLRGVGTVTVDLLLTPCSTCASGCLSCTLAAVTTALCARPVLLSTPM
jgi:hypothetical protein